MPEAPPACRGRPPFLTAHQNDVLTLRLDTPDCEVNIFSNEAAEQLVGIMADVDAQATRAVVLRSGKRMSFLNGARLLMAVAVKEPAAASRLSGQVRQAYQALEQCPVPTFAAIEGNCYGCGVELILRCDYRLACDTADTHFYMTEINDYLVVPVFGATQRLPLLVGLEQATNLLLWGERWSARQAAEHGLVDRVAAPGQLETELQRFVEQNVGRRASGRHLLSQAATVPEVAMATEQRIARLPPVYQQVYRDGFDLMRRAVERGATSDAGRDAEIRAAGHATCQPIAKAALSFFFTRQMAHTLSLGDAAWDPRRVSLLVRGDSKPLRAFALDLAARKLCNASVQWGGAQPYDHDVLNVVLTDPDLDLPPASGLAVQVQLRGHGAQPSPGPAVVHSPLYPSGARLLELAVWGDISADVRLLYRYLTQAGFCVVVSQPRQRYVLEQFLAAYLRPLARYLRGGGAPETVNATLRATGFVRWPHELLAGLGLARAQTLVADDAELQAVLAALQTAELAGEEDAYVFDALCVSLAATADRCRQERTLVHDSFADVIVRELLDFPLGLGNLSRFMSRDRRRQLMTRPSRHRELVDEDALAVLEASLDRRAGVAA